MIGSLSTTIATATSARCSTESAPASRGRDGHPGLRLRSSRRSAAASAAQPISVVLTGPDVEGARRLRRRTRASAPRRRSRDSSTCAAICCSTSRSSTSSIDRDRASDLGVSVREVATALQILLGGVDLSTLQGRRADLRRDRAARARASDRCRRDIPLLYVHGRDGGVIPLSSVAHVTRDHRGARRSALRSPARGDRHGRLRRAPRRAVALEQVRALAEEILPRTGGYRVSVLRRVGAVLRVGTGDRLRLPAGRRW